MRPFLTLAALLLVSSADAQVYKCVANGNQTFSDVPCAASAQKVTVRAAMPSEEDQVAAQSRTAKDIGEVKLREQRAEIERAAVKRKADQEPTRADVCAGIKAKRAEALYWSRRFQHPDNVQAELSKAKAYEDEHFSKCYGTINGNY